MAGLFRLLIAPMKKKTLWPSWPPSSLFRGLFERNKES